MTFIDSEVPATIGEPLDGLLFTCVGVPEYRSASGGLPGAPTDVRGVTPRVLDRIHVGIRWRLVAPSAG